MEDVESHAYSTPYKAIHLTYLLKKSLLMKVAGTPGAGTKKNNSPAATAEQSRGVGDLIIIFFL